VTDGIPVVFTLLLGVIIVWSLLLARSSFRVHARVRRVGTSPINKLSAGPAEIVGRARALGTPPMTVRGEAVIVLRTELETRAKRGNKTSRNPFAHDQVRAVAIEIDDGTGTVAVDVDHVLPVAMFRTTVFSAAEFADKFPELWAKVARDEAIFEVVVRETFVPGDAHVFAAGDAVATDEAVPADDYRATRAKLGLRGTEEHPLLLSAWSEADVRKYVLHPAWLLTATAAVATVVVAALWLARAWIVNAAGLS
jgi:hypothetical protein